MAALAGADTRSCSFAASSLFSATLEKTQNVSFSSRNTPSRDLSLQIVCKESRIGRRPVVVPKEVSVDLKGQVLSVKGPQGALTREYPREVKLEVGADGSISVVRAIESRQARAMHGLFRWEETK